MTISKKHSPIKIEGARYIKSYAKGTELHDDFHCDPAQHSITYANKKDHVRYISGIYEAYDSASKLLSALSNIDPKIVNSVDENSIKNPRIFTKESLLKSSEELRVKSSDISKHLAEVKNMRSSIELPRYLEKARRVVGNLIKPLRSVRHQKDKKQVRDSRTHYHKVFHYLPGLNGSRRYNPDYNFDMHKQITAAIKISEMMNESPIRRVNYY